MKNYQGAVIAALMAMGLAACSSTDMNSSSAGSTGTTRVGTMDAANASGHVNGTSGGGADNSMGNSAGTGNSGVSPNGR